MHPTNPSHLLHRRARASEHTRPQPPLVVTLPPLRSPTISSPPRRRYQQVLDNVCQVANWLRAQGVKKGDAVTIYMPMVSARTDSPSLPHRGPTRTPARAHVAAALRASACAAAALADFACLASPQVCELPIAMLACARIGAVHSVVFGGFSADSLAQRILDCGSPVVITATGSMRGAHTAGLTASHPRQHAHGGVTSCPNLFLPPLFGLLNGT